MFRIDRSAVDIKEPFVVFRPPVVELEEEPEDVELDEPGELDELPEEEEAAEEEEEEIIDPGPPPPDPQELLNEARIECDEMIKAAQDHAQNILDYAEESARILKEKSQNEGYEKGIADSRRELNRITAEQTLAFETLRANITAQQSRLVDDLRTQVLELSVMIAEKIINAAFDDSERYMAFVEGALSYVKEEREAIVKINSDEYEKFFSNGSLPESEMKLTIIPDETLPPGSCYIETNSETVNAGLETQLEAVRLALMQARRT